MKTKHTQGKWWKYKSDSNIFILAAQGKEMLKDKAIAQISKSKNTTQEEKLANAKLIAAAPFKHEKEFDARDALYNAIIGLDNKDYNAVERVVKHAISLLDEAIKEATE